MILIIRAQPTGKDARNRKLIDLRHAIGLHAITAPQRILRHTASEKAAAARLSAVQPRPTKGILVAMMVMNCTLVDSGSAAM